MLAQQPSSGTKARAATVAEVKSKDGTTIAYERSGAGPTLILVASALADRSGARRPAALLAPHFTVINLDRRGRGDSGDAAAYAVAREVEDIDALVDGAGGRALLFGSSSGAVLALEAANTLGKKIDGLVVFEPPFVVDDSRAPITGAFVERMRAQPRRAVAGRWSRSSCRCASRAGGHARHDAAGADVGGHGAAGAPCRTTAPSCPACRRASRCPRTDGRP